MTLALLLTVIVQTTPGEPKTNTATTSAPLDTPTHNVESAKPQCDPRCRPGAKCLETSRGFVCVAKKSNRGRRARSRRMAAQKKKTPSARFGRSGQIAIGGGAGGGIQGTLSEGGLVDLRLGASMRYFATDNLAGRLIVGVQYQDSDFGASQFTGTLGGGLGYNLALGDRTSFLFEAAMIYSAVDVSDRDGADITVLALQFDANIIVLVADHVFFGMGPQLSRSISAKSGGQDAANATVLGVNMQIGVTF